MRNRDSSERDVTVGVDSITFKAPRDLTSEESKKLMDHLKGEMQYAAERWVEAEMDEDGCWCHGLSHRRECRHWVLPH